VGEHDFTRRLLVEAGFEILVSKTNLRPGKPLILAQRGATLAFGLPGNPLAHFMCLNLFVRAALNRLCGVEKTFLLRGQLAVPLTDAANARETFWPARADFSGDVARLTPLRWSSSGDLTALAEANALLRVAPNQTDLPAGTAVEFIPTV
jgi:molybdopterin molybdotransferase